MPTRRKVAMILASLDLDEAVTILRGLPPDDIESLTAEIRELGVIDPELQADIFNEFNERLSKGETLKGGEEVARVLLEEVLGEKKAKELLAKRKTRAFATIVHVDSEDLANILSSEQPSVTALVLGYLPAQKSAEVITFLEPDLREEVISRLAMNRTTDPDTVQRIEDIFVNKVASVIHTSKVGKEDTLGGPKFIAEMFQYIDRALEKQLMNTIHTNSPEQADEIRDLMFTFDDIISLSEPDVQKVMRQVPLDKLVIALRGVDESINEKITGNLSKRAKETLQEEMELLGKVKLSEVEAEQRNIVAIIRGLEASGEIELHAGDGGDVYV